MGLEAAAGFKARLPSWLYAAQFRFQVVDDVRCGREKLGVILFAAAERGVAGVVAGARIRLLAHAGIQWLIAGIGHAYLRLE
jgi:hypothetical protein